MSAVSPRGELRFRVVRGGINACVFIELLKRLVQGSDRTIFLICDGHPSHWARKVTAFVESLEGGLPLFFLPPYSPGAQSR